MSILKMHHPTSHPFWKKNEYKVEIDGQFIDLKRLFYHRFNTAYEIYQADGDIYFVECSCGTGTGKNPCRPPIKIFDKSEYSKIEYIGDPLIISDLLKTDMAECFN